jgi:hypothetical protein
MRLLKGIFTGVGTEQVYDAFSIRIAGQMLSAVENFDLLADLSIRERVTARIHAIAQTGKEVEPDNPHIEINSVTFH